MDISKETFRTLKFFYKHTCIPDEEISKFLPDHIDSLIKNGYIAKDFLGYPDGYNAKYSSYHITDSGKAYVQQYSKSEWFKQNWLQILSVVFAFIAALPVIFQGIGYICGHIM